MSSRNRIVLVLVLLAALLSFTHQIDEDFAFDASDDFEIEFPSEVPKRLHGLSDRTAHVGHVFHLTLPTSLFGEDVKDFEARTHGNNPLPSWLLFDKTSAVFWGVPLEENIGFLYISVKAVGSSYGPTQEFKLVVDNTQDIEKCGPKEENTVLSLVINKPIAAIKPKQRVIAINNISKFFGMSYSEFQLKSHTVSDDVADSSVILDGSGNIERSAKPCSAIQVLVGCEGRLKVSTAPIIHQLKRQSRDGTISEVLQLPLVGWKVHTETTALRREKRSEDNVQGSGDYEYYDYDYDDPDKESEEAASNTTTTSTTPATTHAITPYEPQVISTETHPHRHHHGEVRPGEETETKLHLPVDEQVTVIMEDDVPTIIPDTTLSQTEPSTTTTIISSMPSTIPSTAATSTTTTTTTTTPPPTVTKTTATIEEGVDQTTTSGGLYKPEALPIDNDDDEENDDDYDREDDEEEITEVPTQSREETELPRIDDTLVVKAVTKASTPIEQETTISTTAPPTTTLLTTKAPTITTTTTSTTTTTPPPPTTISIAEIEEEFTTLVKHSTTRHTSTTIAQKPTSPPATETIEYGVKNFPPTIENRLQRIAITAGKVFNYAIPANTFADIEDGNNLKFDLLDAHGQPLKRSSWCQFNQRTREIYGLPLEEDVSRWEYILKATDKDGASISDKIELVVQQHKLSRVVNHEFVLYVHVEKKHEFLHPIDWTLRIFHGLEIVYHTANLTDLTIRSVNYTSDPIVFRWTNSSLPTDYCPKSEIESLYNTLTANDHGDPSVTLSRSLVPEMRVKKVSLYKVGVCEELQPAPPSPPSPTTNYPPILRNPVDHINATIGELLVFRVPDDTFYDPEDVDPRNLKLSLITGERKLIPASNWLQFDVKNKEFFGVPSPHDRRRAEYQLVCEDTGGRVASDSLVVQVHSPPRTNYNIEFSMTVVTDYNIFANSANLKRKFIEKLQELFGDRDTNNIRLSPLTRASASNKNSTLVSWYNKTLTSDVCPWEQIKQLEAVLVNSERIISNRFQEIMAPEFPVAEFKRQYLGVCKVIPTNPKIQDAIVPVDEAAPQSDHDEYLLTFIVPGVIIAIMLLIAAIAACVLYRKKRTGKMNVEEDGRNSYGNKGIPVIFQEELEEKPEPGTKTPCILKDEKPPLAPPEYSKSGSLKLNDDSEPYQPPPPFARAQDKPRPKPTPTYRKPPPYVPP